jgi:hypothetical protein
MTDKREERMHPSIQLADGRPMMVIRPATAEGKRIALQTAAAAILSQKPQLLEQPPADDYIFVGYLSMRGDIVDRHGKKLGRPEAGDSFVTARDEPS